MLIIIDKTTEKGETLEPGNSSRWYVVPEVGNTSVNGREICIKEGWFQRLEDGASSLTRRLNSMMPTINQPTLEGVPVGAGELWQDLDLLHPGQCDVIYYEFIKESPPKFCGHCTSVHQ